ncbi:MAG TPA: hypothetical protein VJ464_16880 [Blastocatellia bacterium]|nr:hypothetical protein [Blastocatellia bacterium]
MRKKKAMTFNLCDYDALHLVFANRKGGTIYAISFDRAFASRRHQQAGKEDERTAQSLRFTHHKRAASIEAASLELAFRAKDAPRRPDAKTHEQTFKLDRPLAISIEGADGADFGTFRWERPGEQAAFDINHEDGSGHSLFYFQPEKGFKAPRRAKVESEVRQ